MYSRANLLAAVMQLPDADRFEIDMSILDRTSPAAMDEDEILDEAIRRQDGLESGAVDTISYEELVRGLRHHPSV